jgi:hypothetical protein
MVTAVYDYFLEDHVRTPEFWHSESAITAIANYRRDIPCKYSDVSLIAVPCNLIPTIPYRKKLFWRLNILAYYL